jgi:hypothetical protein
MKNVGMFYGHLVYCTAIRSIVRPLGLLYGHLIYFIAVWYIFFRFGMLCHENSGNPDKYRPYTHRSLNVSGSVVGKTFHSQKVEAGF